MNFEIKTVKPYSKMRCLNATSRAEKFSSDLVTYYGVKRSDIYTTFHLTYEQSKDMLFDDCDYDLNECVETLAVHYYLRLLKNMSNVSSAINDTGYKREEIIEITKDIWKSFLIDKHGIDFFKTQKNVYWQSQKMLNDLPYTEYLKSDHWIHFRDEAYKWAGHKCHLCNRSDITLNVHHKTYVNKGRETFNDVIVLCRKCHELVHERR